MTAELKILHLPMMYEWYDKIASGEKTTEYGARSLLQGTGRLFAEMVRTGLV